MGREAISASLLGTAVGRLLIRAENLSDWEVEFDKEEEMIHFYSAKDSDKDFGVEY